MRNAMVHSISFPQSMMLCIKQKTPWHRSVSSLKQCLHHHDDDDDDDDLLELQLHGDKYCFDYTFNYQSLEMNLTKNRQHLSRYAFNFIVIIIGMKTVYLYKMF